MLIALWKWLTGPVDRWLARRTKGIVSDETWQAARKARRDQPPRRGI